MENPHSSFNQQRSSSKKTSFAQQNDSPMRSIDNIIIYMLKEQQANKLGEYVLNMEGNYDFIEEDQDARKLFRELFLSFLSNEIEFRSMVMFINDVDKGEILQQVDNSYTKFQEFISQNLKGQSAIKEYLISFRYLILVRQQIIKIIAKIETLQMERNYDELSKILIKQLDIINKQDFLSDLQGSNCLQEIMTLEIQSLIQIIDCIKYEEFDNFTMILMPLTKLKLSLENWRQFFNRNKFTSENNFVQFIYFRNFHIILKSKMFFLYEKFMTKIPGFNTQLQIAKQQMGNQNLTIFNEKLMEMILEKFITKVPTSFVCLFCEYSDPKSTTVINSNQSLNSMSEIGNIITSFNAEEGLDNKLDHFKRERKIRNENMREISKYRIFYERYNQLPESEVDILRQKIIEQFEDLKESIDLYSSRSKQERDGQKTVFYNFCRLNKKWYFASFRVRQNNVSKDNLSEEYTKMFELVQDSWNYRRVAQFDNTILLIFA